MTCARCGAAFVPTGHRAQQYCSVKCRESEKYRRRNNRERARGWPSARAYYARRRVSAEWRAKQSARSLAVYWRNREKKMAANRASYWRHREQRMLQSAAWHKANRPAVLKRLQRMGRARLGSGADALRLGRFDLRSLQLTGRLPVAWEQQHGQ